MAAKDQKRPPLKTPFKNLLPAQSEDESDALKASITKYGVLDPVLIDEEGNVLDGHHRLEIDPDAPTKVVPGLNTDAEKKAFVFHSNNARRNLSAEQKKELVAEQRKVAMALGKQDPKTYTAKIVAQRLGVSESTVSRWLSKENETNLQVQDGSDSKPDARLKTSASDRKQIVQRAAKGESVSKLAKEFGITPPGVKKIVAAEKRKPSDSSKNSNGASAQLEFLKSKVAEYTSAGQPDNASRLKREISQARTEKKRKGEKLAPLAALYRREKDLPAPTRFDEAIRKTEAMLAMLKTSDELTTEINGLAKDTINVDANEKSARLMMERYEKALAELKKKADKARQQPPVKGAAKKAPKGKKTRKAASTSA